MSTSVVKAVTAGLLGSSGLAAYLWGAALAPRSFITHVYRVVPRPS